VLDIRVGVPELTGHRDIPSLLKDLGSSISHVVAVAYAVFTNHTFQILELLRKVVLFLHEISVQLLIGSRHLSPQLHTVRPHSTWL